MPILIGCRVLPVTRLPDSLLDEIATEPFRSDGAAQGFLLPAARVLAAPTGRRANKSARGSVKPGSTSPPSSG